MTVPKTHFDRVLKELTNIGFLHVSGEEIPNVRELLTGKRLKGSWWADAAAQKIFNVTQELEDHTDVTITKLISRKLHSYIGSYGHDYLRSRRRVMIGNSKVCQNLRSYY